MSDFLMPSLGADMEAGILAEWRVQPGDRDRRGDIVAVVETQKGAIEIEVFEDATVAELCVPPGQQVPVGAVLARLEGGRPVAREPAPAPAAAPAPRSVAPSVPVPPPPTAAAGRLRITPLARRRAAGAGVDVSTLHGTGFGGAICLADVERVAGAPAPPPARRAGFDAKAMRAAIAAAMSRSNREIPHYFLTHSCDLGRMLAWLEAANAARPVPERLLPAVLLLKATARALAQVPELNGFWLEDGFRPGPGIHVGWAVSLRSGGLVAPAIHDANRKTLDELMAAVRDLVQRARAGGLRSSELTDPTVTVTNLGERGAEAVLGVIYPPQVALVGFGRVVVRPWVLDGRIEPRPVTTISLAGDHRASDGHRGGQLLAAIDRLLQEPEAL
jgi:pyruvate dehydrogenase E2 component (dihydrolipoamide acetyltransferase)